MFLVNLVQIHMHTSTLVEIILKSLTVEKAVIWDLEINLFNLKIHLSST